MEFFFDTVADLYCILNLCLCHMLLCLQVWECIKEASCAPAHCVDNFLLAVDSHTIKANGNQARQATEFFESWCEKTKSVPEVPKVPNFPQWNFTEVPTWEFPRTGSSGTLGSIEKYWIRFVFVEKYWSGSPELGVPARSKSTSIFVHFQLKVLD